MDLVCINAYTKSILYSQIILPKDYLVFSSDSYPIDLLNTPIAISKVLIFPGMHNDKKQWGYSSLALLLNKLTNKYFF